MAMLAEENQEAMNLTFGARRSYYPDAVYNPRVFAIGEDQLLIVINELRGENTRQFGVVHISFRKELIKISVPTVVLFEPLEEASEVEVSAELHFDLQKRKLGVSLLAQADHLGSLDEMLPPVQEPDEQSAGAVSYLLLDSKRKLDLEIGY